MTTAFSATSSQYPSILMLLLFGIQSFLVDLGGKLRLQIFTRAFQVEHCRYRCVQALQNLVLAGLEHGLR